MVYSKVFLSAGCISNEDCLDNAMKCNRETNHCEYKRCPQWIMNGEIHPSEDLSKFEVGT